MGDTFNAFVKFISDDPIMLGLCIAIIVLVVLFIIVLFIGKKKDTKEETVPEIDKTEELLKTDIDLDSLKSTQEFSVSQINEANSSIEPVEQVPTEQPNVETKNEVPQKEPAVEVPPAIEPQVSNIEVQPTEINSTVEPTSTPIETPIVPIEDSIQQESTVIEPAIPVVEENLDQSQPNVEPVFDLNQVVPEVNNVEPQVSTTQPEQTEEFDIPPIGPGLPGYVEPTTVNEPFIDPLKEMTINENIPVEISIPTEDNKDTVDEVIAESKVVPPIVDVTAPSILEENQIEVVPEITIEESKVNPPESLNVEGPQELDQSSLPKEPPFSSVYLSSDDIPDIVQEPTVNTIETPKETNADVSNEDDFDDLELPKLNTSANSSIFNEIKGESFNIKK